MASSDDYNRELDILLQTTKDKAAWAHHLQSKDFVNELQRRRKAVGWKWSEFYEAFTNDPAATIAELERREQRPRSRD